MAEKGKSVGLERNYKLDNLKAFLIFLVVFGHLMECFSGELRWCAYLVIYTFHMPAFVFTTGYFSRLNPDRLVKNLMYSYFVYQLLYLLFQRYYLGQDNSIQFTTPYWLLWYLMSMIFWSLFLPILDWSDFLRWRVLGIAIFFSLVVGFDRSVGYYLSLSRTVVLFPFFVAGYFRVTDSLMDEYAERGKRRTIFLCSSLLIMVIGLTWRYRNVIQGGWLYHSVSYESGGYSVWIRAGILLVACLWILLLLLVMPQKYIPVISSIGRYTLPIFLLHGFLVRWAAKVSLFRWSEIENMTAAFLVAGIVCLGFGNKWTARILRWTWEWGGRIIKYNHDSAGRL